MPLAKLYEAAVIETEIHAEVNRDLCAIGNDVELMARYLDGLKGLRKRPCPSGPSCGGLWAVSAR